MSKQKQSLGKIKSKLGESVRSDAKSSKLGKKKQIDRGKGHISN